MKVIALFFILLLVSTFSIGCTLSEEQLEERMRQKSHEELIEASDNYEVGSREWEAIKREIDKRLERGEEAKEEGYDYVDEHGRGVEDPS